MNPPLPNAMELIDQSVNDAIKHRKPLFKLNLISFVIPTVISFALANAFASDTLATIEPTWGIGIAIGFLVAIVAGLVASFWYSAHYFLRVLKLLKVDTTPVSAQESRSKTASYLWIGILQFLLLLVIPVISGIISAFLGLGALLNEFANEFASGPGIGVGIGLAIFLLTVISLISIAYLTVRLQFSALSFIQDNKKGAEALKDSWHMSQGRFWSLVWRVIVFVFLYLVASVLVSVLLSLLGPGPVGGSIALIARGAFSAFIVFPVAMFFQVRMYHAYKNTRLQEKA